MYFRRILAISLLPCYSEKKSHRSESMKRIFRPLLLLILMTILSVPVNAAGAPKNKLVTSNGVTVYYNAKGKMEKDRFVTIKKKTYYFDQNGCLVKDKFFRNRKHIYYADASGVIAKNRFVSYRGKRYFFNQKGYRQTGWVTYKNHTYYCPASGEIYKKMWKKIGSHTYYFLSTSYIAKNRWIDGYYINGSGYRTSRKVSDKAAHSKATKKVIKMKNIRQNPQLPTGCESVALTMVLKHYGFKLSKTTIAASYLPKSGSNFVTAFAGNPFSSSGAGIYAPGLKNTANRFFKAKKSKRTAIDVSGMSLENLYPYIDDGTPVIVWNSMYMWNPVAVSSYYTLGKHWSFFRYEHCVVLCGYDKKNQKVLINDPLSGLVWRKKSSFERIYNKLGKMAIVIK